MFYTSQTHLSFIHEQFSTIRLHLKSIHEKNLKNANDFATIEQTLKFEYKMISLI